MVSIRYHIVTLVAVFLALGIGVVVGSTVIDKALVDNLESRVDDLEARLDESRAANDDKQAQLDTVTDLDRRLDEEGPGALLAGDLEGVPVLVVAVDGVDPEPVGEFADTVTSAGGRYQGTVWLTQRLALTDADASVALGDLLGGAGGDAEALRERLNEQFAGLLGGAAAADPATQNGGGGSFDTDEGEASAPDGTRDGVDAPEPAALQELLEGLADEGFVRLDDRPDTDERDLAGVRTVVVSGAGAALADDAFVIPLIHALAVDDNAPMVAAEATTALAAGGESGDGTTASPVPRGSFVGRVRDERELRERVSTVDNLEVFPGRAATVLALDDIDAGLVGHYGVGDGADALLPSR